MKDRPNRDRRIGRVLNIIQLITLQPGYWTRKKLSEHYQRSERMIGKDLELIRDSLGFSLLTDEDGYYFENLPKLPAARFSFSEASALLIAARSAQAFPGVNNSELAAAVSRLQMIFPEQFRPYLKNFVHEEIVAIDGSHEEKMLDLFFQAYSLRKELKISYNTQGSGNVSERIIEPYAVVPYSRSWFLVAFDHKREEKRLFKVDRVESAEITDIDYSIPDDFNVDEFFGDAWGIMRGDFEKVEEVVLLFDKTAGLWISEEKWHKSQVVKKLDDGNYEVRFKVGVTPEMVDWLLYYGSHVQILEPAWLHDEVLNAHQEAVNIQKKNDPA